MSCKTNLIGLDCNKAKTLEVHLDQLLSYFQVLYMNTRGYHWNIKGQDFFELHSKFEEIYTDLLNKTDELAERILTIGCTPSHSFSHYLKQSEIKEHINVVNGKECVQHLINDLSLLLIKERQILSLAGEINDEGTVALMSDYIREQEKLVWMLNSYLQ